MSAKRTVYLSSLGLLLVAFLSLLPLLRAADTPGESKQVSELLAEAKTDALQLKLDASEMEYFPLSDLSWESHAAKLMQIKEHVNKVVGTARKLNEEKSKGLPWQQQAAERVNPLLDELTLNIEMTIDHLNTNRGRPLQTAAYKEYLIENSEMATRLAALVVDSVEYGVTKGKFQKLTQKLEVAEPLVSG